ncbi:MAG: ABC transporter substrate-binding protein [Actinomycetota bacterium]|nr:ABC transporter substrate-binding protein [Actinomycetota bacterium]
MRPRPFAARPRRRLPVLAPAVGLSLLLAGCGGGDAFSPSAGASGGPSGSREPITVGGASFTESLVLMEMYKALLEDGGYQVELQPVDNRELYAPALEKGDIDAVPEYAATLAEFLNRAKNGPEAKPVATSDVDATVQALRGLAAEEGLKVLEPADAANQNAFFVTKAFAQQHGLTTLSDLGEADLPVVLAGTAECPQRPKCQIGLEQVYGIEVEENLPLGFGSVQNRQAVVQGKAQLGLSGTTDGTLGDLGLVVLEDDKGLQNADNLVPVVNAAGPAGTPEVAEVLNGLSATLTTENLAALNRRVDEDREQAADVARSYLEDEGLLGG